MDKIRRRTRWLIMRGRTPAGITPSIIGKFIPLMAYYPHTGFMLRSFDALYESMVDDRPL